MPKNKIVDVGGVRYTVRGLTFEELVKLGSAGTEEKGSKVVVAEVLSRCLIKPRLGREQIARLDDGTLVALVTGVLDIARSGMMDMGFAPMPPGKGPPRDMIV